jgi:hypothetical protein
LPKETAAERFHRTGEEKEFTGRSRSGAESSNSYDSWQDQQAMDMSAAGMRMGEKMAAPAASYNFGAAQASVNLDDITGAAPQPPRPMRGVRESASTPGDGTQDWKLGKKHFSEDAMRKLLATQAAMCMGLSLQVKILRSVCIFLTEVHVNSEMGKKARANTKRYHDALKGMSKDQKRSMPPPFILVVEALLDTSADYIGKLALEPDNWINLAFTAYRDRLINMDPEAKATYLLTQWRYARVRNTWQKSRIMIELCICPLATAETEAVLKAIMQLMIQCEEGTRKHGIAPKTQQEHRVESVLKTLGVFR